MAFQVVPLTIQCAVLQRLHGQQVVNTLSFRANDELSGSALNAFAAFIADQWNDVMMPVLSQNLTLEGVRAYALYAGDADVGVFDYPAPVLGGVGIPALPGNAAYCVQFGTGGRGRTSRGRCFVSGLPEGSVVGNTLDDSFATALVSGLIAIRVNTLSFTAVQVVISRFINGVKRPIGVTRDVTSTLAIDPFLDSQRRRLTGRGV